MPKPSKYKPLSAEQLGKLFGQLKRMELSGLPVVQAFAVLADSETELKKPLSLMLQQLNNGVSVSEAGHRAGIFDSVHKSLLHAAEASGRLAEVYNQLDSHYTGLARRIKKVKSRLYFPAVVLTMAMFLQPLSALIAANITGFGYLWLSLGRLLTLAIGVFLLVKLPAILRNLGAEAAWHRLQLRIPAVAGWIAKRQVNEFFFILAMLLESGLAFSEALPKAVAGIRNTALRNQFKPALSSLGAGGSVADTLAKVALIDPAMRAIIRSSEQSGKLAGGILHFTQIEAETIGLQDDAIAAWLPRLVYAVIASWMAYSLLSGQLPR